MSANEVSNVVHLPVATFNNLDAPAAAPEPEEGTRDSEAALFWAGSDADLDFFAANSRRELALWGRELLRDKRLLQQMGMGCWFATAKGTYSGGRRTAWINVGKGVLSIAEFKAMAQRERERMARQRREAA
jgi:hypothetical protein